MEELVIKLAESNDIVEGQCPHCGIDLTDDCPPDYDMTDRIECPNCGEGIDVTCDVVTERTYSFDPIEEEDEDE